VTVVAANAVGPSLPSAPSAAVRVDTTAPSVSSLAVVPAAGGTIGSAVPTKLTWVGSDAGSGIGHYEVWLSTNGGSFVLVASPTSATYTRSLTASTTTTYRFEVRAIDNVGNRSSFVLTPTFHVKLIQQTSATFGGTWTTTTTTSASGGSYRYCTASAASAWYTFTGRAIAIVAAVGTQFGSFKVYIDGVYVTTVSEYASSLAWRRIVYAQRWSASGTHTIKLVNLATSGHPRLDLDAFVVLG
jgi:hypothetical protein